MKSIAAVFIAIGFAVLVAAAPAGAFDRGNISVEAGKHGDVILHVWGIGRTPAQALNPAQAAAAAHNAAEIDAYSRVAYLLGRVDRAQGRDGFVASFRGHFKGIHVEKSERQADGTVRAEVVIPVPAKKVPELLKRIDEYIGELEAGSSQPGEKR